MKTFIISFVLDGQAKSMHIFGDCMGLALHTWAALMVGVGHNPEFNDINEVVA